MGLEQNKRDQKKDAAKEAKISRRVQRNKPGETADWGSVEPAALVDAVGAVTAQGGALRFGYTRDGGAYCVGILGDGEPYNDYIKPSEDIDEYLRNLAQSWRE